MNTLLRNSYRIGSRLAFFYVIVWIFTGCVRQPTNIPENTIEQSSNTDVPSVEMEMSAIYLTRDEIYAEADAIFVGTVVNISNTRWNQDSGEYWEETTVEDEAKGLSTIHSAWPVHEVEVLITQPIVDDIGLERTVTLTFLGASPTNNGLTTVNGREIQVEGGEEYNWQINDEVLIFAEQSEMAWRDPSQAIQIVEGPNGRYVDVGIRNVLGFVAAPSISYLIRSDDGLFRSPTNSIDPSEPITVEALIQEIAQKRTIAQP